MKPHTVHHSADGLRTAQQSLSNKKHNSNREFFFRSHSYFFVKWTHSGRCAAAVPQFYLSRLIH